MSDVLSVLSSLPSSAPACSAYGFFDGIRPSGLTFLFSRSLLFFPTFLSFPKNLPSPHVPEVGQLPFCHLPPAMSQASFALGPTDFFLAHPGSPYVPPPILDIKDVILRPWRPPLWGVAWGAPNWNKHSRATKGQLKKTAPQGVSQRGKT